MPADYCFGQLKFGGNAQAITKQRFLHHTSLLWDYEDANMLLLKHPDRVPDYRQVCSRPACVFPGLGTTYEVAVGISVAVVLNLGCGHCISMGGSHPRPDWMGIGAVLCSLPECCCSSTLTGAMLLPGVIGGCAHSCCSLGHRTGRCQRGLVPVPAVGFLSSMPDVASCTSANSTSLFHRRAGCIWSLYAVFKTLLPAVKGCWPRCLQL